MARTYTLLRKRLMPIEGGIRHLPGIEMYGNSIPAGTVGGDILEYINFQQRYDIDALIERALKRSKEYLEALPPGTPPRNAVDAHIQQRRGALVAETSRMASTQCLRPVWRGTLPGPADEDALVLWALLACALLVLTQLSLLANSIEKSLRRVNFHALAHQHGLRPDPPGSV